MLSWMRNRRFSRVAFILFAAIALSFVVGFGFGDLRNRQNSGAAGPVVAQVYGENITQRQYDNAVRFLAQIRGRTPGADPEQIAQEALDGLVKEAVLAHRAGRLGLRVTDEELAAVIQKSPSFLDEATGKFDRGRYNEAYPTAILRVAFESDQRRGLLVRKMRELISNGAQVSPAEIAMEYERADAKMKLEILSLDPEALPLDVAATDEAIRKQYDGNPDSYRTPEKRQVEFVSIDMKNLRGEAAIPPEEIARYYEEHKAEFETPLEVKASHILYKSAEGDAPEKDAEQRAKAEKALARAEGGEDFAAMAKAESQDPSAAANGGDLGWFGRGRMVPPFEEAAFAMNVGDIRGPVKTSFGYHVIRLSDRRGGDLRPLAEVKTEIEGKLQEARKGVLEANAKKKLEALLADAADLKKLASEHDFLKYHAVGPFERAVAELDGVDPNLIYSFREKAFQTDKNAPPVPFGNAERQYALKVTAVEESALPELEAVREKVKADVERQLRREAAQQRAEEWLADWKDGKDVPAEQGKTAGVAHQTTEPFTLGSFTVPVLGFSPEFNDIKRDLTPEAPFSGSPIEADGKFHLVKLAERIRADAEGLEAQREALRTRLERQKAAHLMDRYIESATAQAEAEGEVDIRLRN